MAPVITRLVLTDDDGTGLTGTPLNNALFQDLQNRIDQLSAAIVASFPVVPGGVVTTANLAAALNTTARARTTTITNPATVNADRSHFEVYVIDGLAQALTINAPVWGGAGGIGPYDDASLVYRIKDNGTTQALTWTGLYPLGTVPLPTATVAGRNLHVAFRYVVPYNAWFCVAMATD